MEDFDSVCHKYKIWVIKYLSSNFNSQLYCIWFTDEDDSDKLLTLENGKIFAAKSIHAIKDLIYRDVDRVNTFARLTQWLKSFKTTELIECHTYDVRDFVGTIKSGILTLETIQSVVDFMNLFGDFARQHENNYYLLDLVGKQSLRQLWEYYYNFIFWPEFNNPENSAVWHVPPQDFEANGLIDEIEKLVASFDARLELLE